MATPLSAMDALELSKENVMPLKSGRTMSGELRKGLSASAGGKKPQSLALVRAGFETELAQEGHADPLATWCKFVKWTQASYPSSTEEVVAVLERCTREFMASDRYQQDPRYLKLWIKYADLCEDPEDVYAFLADRGIGLDLSMFYWARATMHETVRSHGKAAEAFEAGARRAPDAKLLQLRTAFEHRQVKRAAQAEEEALRAAAAAPAFERKAMGRISRKEASGSHRRMGHREKPAGRSWVAQDRDRGSSRSASSRKPSGSGCGRSRDNFQVFSGGESSGAAARPAASRWDLGTKKSRSKENTQAPSRWTDVQIKQNETANIAPPARSHFSVHIEPTFEKGLVEKNAAAPAKAEEPARPNAMRLQTEVPIAKPLQSDPLQNMRAAPEPNDDAENAVPSEAEQQEFREETSGPVAAGGGLGGLQIFEDAAPTQTVAIEHQPAEKPVPAQMRKQPAATSGGLGGQQIFQDVTEEGEHSVDLKQVLRDEAKQRRDEAAGKKAAESSGLQVFDDTVSIPREPATKPVPAQMQKQQPQQRPAPSMVFEDVTVAIAQQPAEKPVPTPMRPPKAAAGGGRQVFEETVVIQSQPGVVQPGPVAAAFEIREDTFDLGSLQGGLGCFEIREDTVKIEQQPATKPPPGKAKGLGLRKAPSGGGLGLRPAEKKGLGVRAAVDEPTAVGGPIIEPTFSAEPQTGLDSLVPQLDSLCPRLPAAPGSTLKPERADEESEHTFGIRQFGKANRMSLCEPTLTFNTKLAMDEVGDMFGGGLEDASEGDESDEDFFS